MVQTRNQELQIVQQVASSSSTGSEYVNKKLLQSPLKFYDHHIDSDFAEEPAIRRSARHKTSVFNKLSESFIVNHQDLDDIYSIGRMQPSFQRSNKVSSNANKLEKTPSTSSPVKTEADTSTPRYKRVRMQIISAEHESPRMLRSRVRNLSSNKDSNSLDGKVDYAQSNEEGNDDTEDNQDVEDEEDERKSYNLREKRRAPEYFTFEDKRSRSKDMYSAFPRSHAVRYKRSIGLVPTPTKRYRRLHKKSFHGDSSSTDSSSSDDEKCFERRKKRSMKKARLQCLPMNLEYSDLTSAMKDRKRIGSSLADVAPMTIDKTITFESIGGLTKQIRSLKEMIIFPILYPEFFSRFNVNPPRGCLFYGPPGTGKTLVARALANECSHGDRKVSFFMRKGADCLSKWIGESERQLRLLFDQAYQLRPSIIFFDEIDGLAPVRSSRQDQIHSSIVSTLLALMDGLDSRGEIIVIGATNRIDSIDPALRRPGRFDREFLFSLPSKQNRKEILQIHTSMWKPPLSDELLDVIANQTSGYCGADLQSLCSESTLVAMRRSYPQVYLTSKKLSLNFDNIKVEATDFFNAMSSIVPSSRRSQSSRGRALDDELRKLLGSQIHTLRHSIMSIFPALHSKHEASKELSCQDIVEGLLVDSDFNDAAISAIRSAYSYPTVYKPRVLLSEDRPLQCMDSHILPALLHSFEDLSIHTVDLTALYSDAASGPEESCIKIFREARRCAPSVIYFPSISEFLKRVSSTVHSIVYRLINELPPNEQVLLLTSLSFDSSIDDDGFEQLFSPSNSLNCKIRDPYEEEIHSYFYHLIMEDIPKTSVAKPAYPAVDSFKCVDSGEVAARPLTKTEIQKIESNEATLLRELRIYLRDVLNRIAREKKFNIFLKPVDAEEVPDYYDVITNPMDLTSMMNKVDSCQYTTVEEFLCDIDTITENALEYNPPKDSFSQSIRHRACALRDSVYSIVKTEIDTDFEKNCEEAKQSRLVRGSEPVKQVPHYFYTKQFPEVPTSTNISEPKPTLRSSSRLYCPRRKRFNSFTRSSKYRHRHRKANVLDSSSPCVQDEVNDSLVSSSSHLQEKHNSSVEIVALDIVDHCNSSFQTELSLLHDKIVKSCLQLPMETIIRLHSSIKQILYANRTTRDIESIIKAVENRLLQL